MNPIFSHEKLRAYEESIKFLVFADDVLQTVPKSLSVWDQLDRAAASVPLNIAQGNGKYSAPERCRFFDIARGSALECSACLDVLWAKGKVPEPDCISGKKNLQAIVLMLVGLLRSSSPVRLHEPGHDYQDNSQNATAAGENVTLPGGKIFFDHERLRVFIDAIEFVRWAGVIIGEHPGRLLLPAKLDRASTAIPLGIAEGNGKFTAPDRCRFFDNARTAALECAACLDALVAKKKLGIPELQIGKEKLQQIVSMLVGLIRSNSAKELKSVKYTDSAPASDITGVT